MRSHHHRVNLGNLAGPEPVRAGRSVTRQNAAIRWRSLRWTHYLGCLLVGISVDGKSGGSPNSRVVRLRASGTLRYLENRPSAPFQGWKSHLPKGAQTSDTRCRPIVTVAIDSPSLRDSYLSNKLSRLAPRLPTLLSFPTEPEAFLVNPV
jgi:hypothetical protein